MLFFLSCPVLLMLSIQYVNFTMFNFRPRPGSRACAARSASSCQAAGLFCVRSMPYLVEKVVPKGLTRIRLLGF